MKYSTFTFIIASLLTLSLEAKAQISVNFQAKADVTDAKVLLADIAVIEPPGNETANIGQIPVTTAPVPGTGKELSTVSVITSLRNRPEVANVDWQGSETITVYRKGNRISQEQVQQIIADYLKENSAKLPKSKIRFTTSRPPDELTVPIGKLSWKVKPSRSEILGSSSFSISFAVDDKHAGSCVARGTLEALADVATAEVTLHKGDLITTDNIVLKQQNIGAIEKPFMTKEQILGMQVARTVAAGKAIEQKHIVSPPIIKDGDQVKIIARKGELQISTSGTAKANARLGESIRVKNVSSGKLIFCRVDGPGIVSVEF